jgi:D-alanyl-D-alanine carboxypeptidase
LIAVTLNAPDDWDDHREMLDRGFANFDMVDLVNEGLYIRTFRIRNEYIGIVAGGDLRVALRGSEREMIEIEYEIPDEVSKNVRNGDIIGEMRAVLDGEVMSRANLVIRRQENGRRDSFAEIYGELWRGLTTFR